jgi:hypothetical protein
MDLFTETPTSRFFFWSFLLVVGAFVVMPAIWIVLLDDPPAEKTFRAPPEVTLQ